MTNMTAVIELAWAAWWTVVPFVALPYAAIVYGRRVLHGTDRDWWADEWVPLSSDVAAIDADLPTMVARA